MKFRLLYDDDCYLCTLFKSIVRFLDPKRRLEYIPLQSNCASAILKGISHDGMLKSFHIVAPSSKIYSGERALPVLASLLPLGKVFGFILATVPWSRTLIEAAYKKIALHKREAACRAKEDQEHLLIRDHFDFEDARRVSTILQISEGA